MTMHIKKQEKNLVRLRRRAAARLASAPPPGFGPAGTGESQTQKKGSVNNRLIKNTQQTSKWKLAEEKKGGMREGKGRDD